MDLRSHEMGKISVELWMDVILFLFNFFVTLIVRPTIDTFDVERN